MKKYTRICESCGRKRRFYTLTRRCWKCYNRSRGIVSVPKKECQYCADIIPRVINGKKLEPAQYKRRKFCNRSCSSAHTILQMRKKGWESSAIYPRKNKPSREFLNRLFSDLRSYRAMAKHLGVSRSLIAKWLGPERAMRHPLYYN